MVLTEHPRLPLNCLLFNINTLTQNLIFLNQWIKGETTCLKIDNGICDESYILVISMTINRAILNEPNKHLCVKQQE